MDKNEYKRTKFGDFMYKITINSGLFVARHKWLFYLLSYTWGILTTVVGWIILAFVRVFLRRKIVEKGQFFTANYTIFGNNWGGFSFGTNFSVAGNMGDNFTLHCKCHELGHTYQAAVFGPFVIFFFYLPSLFRCLYQKRRDDKKLPNDPYDLAYFEASASHIGQVLLSKKESKDYFYYTDDFKRNPNYGRSFKEND